MTNLRLSVIWALVAGSALFLQNQYLNYDAFRLAGQYVPNGAALSLPKPPVYPRNHAYEERLECTVIEQFSGYERQQFSDVVWEAMNSLEGRTLLSSAWTELEKISVFSRIRYSLFGTPDEIVGRVRGRDTQEEMGFRNFLALAQSCQLAALQNGT